jgi:DNA-binding CsgD family transcriptional regulator
LVANATVDGVSERPVAITPRVLAHILRDVRAQDVVATAPPDLTLADLDADVTASLAPDVTRALRRAVADHVRQRSYHVSRIKPFTEMPPGLAISDLDLSVRAFNALTRFPRRWLHAATIGDVLDTPGLGAAGLVEVLAAYEAAVERLGVAVEGEPVAITTPEESEPEHELEEAPIPQRVLEMRELYDAGATLGEVAGRFGISRERVRQLFRAHGLPTRSIAEAAALRREQLVREHREQILELIDAGVAPNEIAERLEISTQLVHDAVHDDPGRRRLAAFRRTAKTRPKPKYSDEEIIECLRTASVELGGVLTTAEYSNYARTRRFPDGRPWPLHQTPSLRFGSWRRALQLAGLEANPPSAIAGQRIFTREHCIDAILEVERELGHPPTAAEYERSAAASNGILPSLATVRHRCGGWQEALVFAARFSQ